MKHIKKLSAIPILLLLTTLFSCEQQIKEPILEYYEVEGVGYVYKTYSRTEPIPNYNISVTAYFISKGLSTRDPIKQQPTQTDETGKYTVNFFLKSVDMEDVAGYIIGGKWIAAEEVKNAENTLKIDTIWSIP